MITLTDKEKTRNQKLMIAIIEYLQKKDYFQDVNIYTNGHKYSCDKHPGDIELHTKHGPYYDCGEWDVETQIEYNNPKTLTMTFEGPLYHDYNGTAFPYSKCHAERDITKICNRFGLYPEQGYAWSLACYE